MAIILDGVGNGTDVISSGDGSNPVEREVFLDGTGGTEDSGYVIVYIINDTPGSLTVTVEPVSEDSGVVWKVSDDAVNWYDSVDVDMSFTYPPVSQLNTPIGLKAIVDNDGSVSAGIKTSCKIRLTY